MLSTRNAKGRCFKRTKSKTPEDIAERREAAIRKCHSDYKAGHVPELVKGGRTANIDTIRAKMKLNSARYRELIEEVPHPVIGFTFVMPEKNRIEADALMRENDMLANKLGELSWARNKEENVKRDIKVLGGF